MTDKLDPKEQHAKITGYRKLTEGEIQLMNDIKAVSADVHAVFRKVHEHLSLQADECPTQEEFDRIRRAMTEQCYNKALIDFEAAIMLLVRAVAQPECLLWLREQNAKATE